MKFGFCTDFAPRVVYDVLLIFQMQVRNSSPVTVPDNNNLYKKVRASDRDSPPPGSIPREDRGHLSRSSSHMSCEGEGHFIPEEHDVSSNRDLPFRGTCCPVINYKCTPYFNRR